MKVKFGAMMVDARGKLGGHVFSKNRGGAYARTKTTPVNPQTSYQSAVRAAFTEISQAWRSLTDAQRKSFDASVSNFARTDVFGDLKNPSGANLHQRLNLNLNAAGASYITEAPALTASPGTFEYTITVNGTTPAVSVAWTSGAIPAGTAVIVEATAPQSPGKSYVKNQFRQLGILPAADTTPTSFLTEYQARFGNPVTGEKVVFRCKIVDTTTGIAGPYTVVSAIAS